MNRRSALARITAITGAAVTAPTLSFLLQGCQRPAQFVPKILTPEARSVLDLLTQIIIPETDTPGANEAGVVPFIDQVVAELFLPEDQVAFLSGLRAIESRALEENQEPLGSLNDDQLFNYVRRLDTESVEARNAGDDPLPTFALIKELTIVGYYTSRVGLQEELNYAAIPASYEACLPLDEIGRRWI